MPCGQQVLAQKQHITLYLSDMWMYYKWKYDPSEVPLVQAMQLAGCIQVHHVCFLVPHARSARCSPLKDWSLQRQGFLDGCTSLQTHWTSLQTMTQCWMTAG